MLSDLTAGKVRIIEGGEWPRSVAGFLPAANRLLIDPLAEIHCTNEDPDLRSPRNPEARYLKGGGEALPSESSAYDLAIIENCIDHVRDANGVMRELGRVLRPGGILYLTVNCRTPIGFYVHRVLSTLRLDPGHPHTFTPERLRRVLQQFGFELLDMKVGSYQKAHDEDLNSASLHARRKSLLPSASLSPRLPYSAALVILIERMDSTSLPLAGTSDRPAPGVRRPWRSGDSPDPSRAQPAATGS